MIRILSRKFTKLTTHRPATLSCLGTRSFCEKIEKTETQPPELIGNENSQKLGGFAKAFEKYTKPIEDEPREQLPDLPFATLLRNSKLIDVSCEIFTRNYRNCAYWIYNININFSLAIPKTKL